MKINLFRKLPPLWDIKAKVNLHRLSEIYFRYYLLHIRNCIVINNFNTKLLPVSKIHRKTELYVLQESAIWLLLLVNVHLFHKAVKKLFPLQVGELII